MLGRRARQAQHGAHSNQRFGEEQRNCPAGPCHASWAITCDLTRNPFFSVGSIVTRKSGASLHPLGLTVDDDSSACESRRITVGMDAGGYIDDLIVAATSRRKCVDGIDLQRQPRA